MTRLAASNIAWDASDDDRVARMLVRMGYTGIEIAPTKWRSDPTSASASAVAEYRSQWTDRGLVVVALQALLHGRPDLLLFGSAAIRVRLSEYLKRMIELASQLGAGAIVFGAPSNRRRNSVPLADAVAIAADFFRDLGERAAPERVRVCIEPNPVMYGCDFLTTTAEAADFCKRVAHPAVRLQLDGGSVASDADDPRSVVARNAALIGHVHASEPNLVELGTARAPHEEIAEALRACAYDGWISVETRATSMDSLERSCRRVADIYAP